MKTPFKIIRPVELSEMLSVSLVTLWRMEKRGELPPRKKISKGTVGWLESDLIKWLKDRPNAVDEEETQENAK